MSYDIREGVIELGDNSMDYGVFGKGTEPLLLIRGLNIRRLRGNVSAQTRRYRTYADNFRVYVIDRREPLPDKIDCAMLAEDVYEGARALGLTRALVMGNSQGGMIAQYLALNHPEFVKKLVLNVTTAEPNPTLAKSVSDWVATARTGDMTRLSDEMMSVLYPPGKEPAPAGPEEVPPGGFKVHPPEEFIALAEACLTVNTAARLGEIKCPTLVLGGGKDVVMSQEASIDLAKGLGTEAVIFGELGHAAYETAEYQELVKEFLEQ